MVEEKNFQRICMCFKNGFHYYKWSCFFRIFVSTAVIIYLTLSRRRLLSYRNQSIDLWRKSMDWFLYNNGLRLNFLRRKLVTNYEWAQSGLSLKTILNLGKINMFFFSICLEKDYICVVVRDY